MMCLTETEMLILATRAIGRIDARGPRGAEECPIEEIEAMAALLVCLGIPALPYAGPPTTLGRDAPGKLQPVIDRVRREIGAQIRKEASK